MKTIYFYLITWICLLIIPGCTKDFLAKKPDAALLVPSTLADLQALLDNLSVMNVAPGITAIADGTLYTTSAGLSAYKTPAERNSYTWAQDIFEGTASSDWSVPYQQIFYANIVLDGLKGIKTDISNQADYNRIKGSAQFFRAIGLFHLAQLFCKPYNKISAGTDLGVPIPLTSDVNTRPGRETVQQTYDQMLTDLKSALQILPATSIVKSRPAKSSANALLARICLTMGDYENALAFASACLQVSSTLLDYNNFSLTGSSPFPAALPNGNDEVLFHAVAINYSFIRSALTGIDTNILKTFSANDLRKALFFNPPNVNKMVRLKNDYAGSAGVFAGIATDEVYLIAAECYARKGDINSAMLDLNTLLIKRHQKGTFTGLTASTADEALAIILAEREKEMFTNRGVMRWSDLRRLNQDGKVTDTLIRVVNGQTYQLLPNSNRYVYPIPDNEISASGIQQNLR